MPILTAADLLVLNIMSKLTANSSQIDSIFLMHSLKNRLSGSLRFMSTLVTLKGHLTLSIGTVYEKFLNTVYQYGPESRVIWADDWYSEDIPAQQK